jgi:hypothetical protein
MRAPITQTCHTCHKLAMEMAQTSNGSKTQSKIVSNVACLDFVLNMTIILHLHSLDLFKMS